MSCGALICAGAIIIAVAKNKPKLEIAAKKVDEPKAITEVVARAKNTNNFTYVESLDGIQVPVPRGYVASGVEDEKYVNGVTTNGERVHSGGFVIYEGTEPVTSANIDEAQRTRNQYVWVPIDSEEAAEGRMYNIKNGALYGNSYNFTESGAGDPVTAQNEPFLSVRYDNDQRYLKQYMEGISRSEFLQEMREEFYEMIVSVKTYGGFYIGRYETGNTRGNELKVVKMQTGTASSSNPSLNNINCITWYKAYTKSRALRGTAPVHTSLIWMIQWYETLKWLIESEEKTAAQIIMTTSWGNCPQATITYTDVDGISKTKRAGTQIVIPAGASEDTKANNIYDLAGNVSEWTMGGYVNSGERYMLGSNIYSGFASSTARGSDEPYETSTGYGSRSVLYII